ncbi:hypothetical protein N658DRAFT_484033 [Parathielavia hyrcaniae]|uniref:GAR domain-containing protein n=1 Tax=Parathielavia hyrcaniae TaxID=113614 RepID=A0AAN6Q913_9PEZI|nr:hypothetical protein N658DRAFT_484033 [Parathielavia hyrcaniae]
MNDPLLVPAPGPSPAHLAPTRGRHQRRSTSDYSMTRHPNTDDLLTNLTPRAVVSAFRNPSGPLKACIQTATPAEQAFALRVAIASNSIHEWLDELSAWPWPAGGGSAGFEMPPANMEKLPMSSPPASADAPERDTSYSGSVPSSELARYEKRIEDMAQGLEELDIEEIKSQVLNNHIMPLSRPGTPILDPGRSISSLSSFAKLDDLTALVTATTVQALPNLSKLTRLMTAWSFRLLVLRKIPVFLTSLANAEVALQSGWNAINLGPNRGHATDITESATANGPAVLSREEFDVMRSVLERKVAKVGRDLDAMLDVLEGQPDTLPEAWIDRVDVLEQGYGEWTVACERKVKETDLASLLPQVVPTTTAPEQPLHGTTETAADAPTPSGSPADKEMVEPPENRSFTSEGTLPRPSLPPQAAPPVIRIHPSVEDEAPQPEDNFHESDAESAHSELDGTEGADLSSMLASDPVETVQEEEGNHASAITSQALIDSELSDTAEPSLLQGEQLGRRASNASQSSTVIHEAPSAFTDSFSSDLVDQGTPERPRQMPMPLDEGVSGFESFQSSTRSMSVSFNDKPTVTELPGSPSPPSTPTKYSILEEDAATEPGSPSEMSMPGSDDQLQQQISEILESVPAKIRLTAALPAVNLNPPDFKMPTTRKNSRSDAIPRSQSTVSMRSAYSRSATPSFTLAPARGARPRHQRGNQEIKLYHLSRSNGEAPIKLFIRCVGEHGERVMVRVGGGWADLGEYLKEYASHHLRRAAGAAVADSRIEVKDVPRNGAVRADSTPPSRPASAMDAHSPISPLKLRKTRRPPPPPPPLPAAPSDEHHHQHVPPPLLPPVTPGAGARASSTTIRPKTPLASSGTGGGGGSGSGGGSGGGRLDRATPPSDGSSHSSRSSRLSGWDPDDDETAALGMAGPRAKQIRMSEESRAWVESVKEKVRIASGGSAAAAAAAVANAAAAATATVGSNKEGGAGAGVGVGVGGAAAGGGLEASLMERFGEMGKVGRTKRIFRRG